MMHLHNIDIGPRHIRVDGMEIIAEKCGVEIQHRGPIAAVRLTILAKEITLNGDRHDPPGETPIYDQLLKETHK